MCNRSAKMTALKIRHLHLLGHICAFTRRAGTTPTESKTYLHLKGLPVSVSLCVIIRRFTRDDHVMNVTFTQSRIGDPDEAPVLLKFGNRCTTEIAHP